MKVVLSGEGADELFGGYNIYREPLALQKVAWIPEKIRRAVSRQAKKLPDRRGKSFLIRPANGWRNGLSGTPIFSPTRSAGSF